MEGNSANMYMPVAPAYNGGYGENGFFGGNGAWFLLILLAMFGWGNGFGGYGGGSMNGDLQRGFDQAALTNGIGQIQNALTNGFAQAEIAANGRQMADMNQAFALQTAFQNCCCENRLATAGLNTAIAQEGAATRAASAADRQMIMDKLCQLEMDSIKQNYETRIAGMQNALDQERSNNQALRFAASQGAQTAQILANNEAQTTAIEQYLAPTARPAYIVQNPNCCQQFGWTGCNNMG